jgi:putative NADH-flavin reductase
MITVVKTIAVRNDRTNKFSITFDIIRTRNGESWISAECQSAPVFDTAEEAHAGGDRAVAVYNETDRFPNMCEAF